jgi:hypothetical protein
MDTISHEGRGTEPPFETKEPAEMIRSLEQSLSPTADQALEEDPAPDDGPSPLVGLVAGVLLSVALWVLIGCAALVLRVLGVI